MKKVDIKLLHEKKQEFTEKEIVVAGWVRSCRGNGNFGFIDLNDGTSFKGLQVVFTRDNISNFDSVEKLNTGSAVTCKGKIILTPENKQPFEMQAQEIEIINATDNEYPLQKKGHSMEFLREMAYLRPRTNLFNAVFRVRSESAFALHKFFNEQGFVYLHAPILTSSDCEGAGELFRVSTQDIYSGKKLDPKDELFGKAVFLSPSCQLEGEAFALSMGKIYTFVS